jgi:Zn-dependent membrane protease YugP
MLNKNLVKVFAIIFSVAIVFTSISTPVKVLADSKTQQNYVEVMNSVTEIDDIQELKKYKSLLRNVLKIIK